jgi:UDP-N-acetylglucosamine 2-epimerase
MNKQEIKELKQRLAVFADSKEVCAGLRTGDSYWPEEAAVHIEGLWDLAKELMKHLEKNNKQLLGETLTTTNLKEK